MRVLHWNFQELLKTHFAVNPEILVKKSLLVIEKSHVVLLYLRRVIFWATWYNSVFPLLLSVCGTICHLISDKSSAVGNSHKSWKHFCFQLDSDGDAMRLFLSCAIQVLLITYLLTYLLAYVDQCRINHSANKANALGPAKNPGHFLEYSSTVHYLLNYDIIWWRPWRRICI